MLEPKSWVSFFHVICFLSWVFCPCSVCCGNPTIPEAQPNQVSIETWVNFLYIASKASASPSWTLSNPSWSVSLHDTSQCCFCQLRVTYCGRSSVVNTHPDIPLVCLIVSAKCKPGFLFSISAGCITNDILVCLYNSRSKVCTIGCVLRWRKPLWEIPV